MRDNQYLFFATRFEYNCTYYQAIYNGDNNSNNTNLTRTLTFQVDTGKKIV